MRRHMIPYREKEKGARCPDIFPPSERSIA